MKDAAVDRVDHLFTSKLRVLCGRRKKNITLLGGSWCEELDGGDPLVVSYSLNYHIALHCSTSHIISSHHITSPCRTVMSPTLLEYGCPKQNKTQYINYGTKGSRLFAEYCATRDHGPILAGHCGWSRILYHAHKTRRGLLPATPGGV